jgi:hypothetical protein
MVDKNYKITNKEFKSENNALFGLKIQYRNL